MAIVSDIEIRLRADIARLQTDMTAVRNTVDGTLQGINRTAQNLKTTLGALFAGIITANLVKDVTLLNARFETMGVVMGVAGNNAGYTKAEMAGLEKELQKTGISMIKARENLTSLATANIDLSKATKLARAAQDLAVVGNVNSSEAFTRLIHGIKAGEVEVLRNLGLNVSFENSYKKLATQLGTTTEKLTEHQKMQARTNEVLQQSATYAGIYEESMGTAGKQILSMSRYVEDAKVKIGATFNQALTVIVGNWTDALKGANSELDKLGKNDGVQAGVKLAEGVTVAIKGLAYFGTTTVATFKILGRELGGFAAVLGQVFTAPLRAVNGLGAALDAAFKGDFSGAADKASQSFKELGNGIDNVKMIWADLGTQYEKDISTLGDTYSAISQLTAGTKEQTQAEKDAADAKEQMRMAAGAAARAAQEAEAKRLMQQAEAHKQQLKYDSAYKQHIKDIYERTAAVQLDMATDGKLTEGQRYAIKVMDDLRTGEIKLSAAKSRKLGVMLEEYLTEERLNAARDADRKAQADAEAAIKAETDGAWDQVRAMQEQVRLYGLTEVQVLQLKAAEYDRQMQNGDLSELEQQRISMLLAATGEQIKLQTQLTKMKADTAFWTSMEDAAHQAFLSIQNGGASMWQRLKDSAKTMFFDWLYQMTVKKWIINIGASISGTAGVSGIANAAGLASSVGAGVTGQISTLAGIASLIGSAGGIATGAMQTAGALLSGTIGAGTTLSAGFGALTSGSAAGASAGLASIAGVVAPIAIAALAGTKLLGAAFGMGAKNVTSTTLQGMLTPAGATASTVQAWTQKGGWFRSDKSGKDSTALAATQTDAFASTYKAILDVSKVMGDTLGADTAALSTRVQQLNIDLTGLTDAAKQQEAIAKFFAGVGDSIAGEIVPGLQQFQTEGEALSATLQRVATDYASVDVILKSVGKSFGSVGVASIAAREHLIAAAGGLDKLSSGLSYFRDNFLKDEEKLAQAQADLQAQMQALGISSLKTTDDFKQYALGLDLTNAAQADLFAKMLTLAPAFKYVADAADAATKAASDKAAADVKAAQDLAAAKVAEELQRIADTAKLLTGAVNSALEGVSRAVDVQKAKAQTAYEALAAALDASIATTSARISDLQGLSDLLKQRVTVGSSAQSAITRQVAAAAIAAAAQVAQQTGVLPAADAIRDAVGALRSDSADNYASLLDYQRAAASANNDIAALGGVTDTQLSVAQNTLQVLQDQKAFAKAAYDAEIAGLDAQLAKAQEQVDVLNGINKSTTDMATALANLAAAISSAAANPISGAGMVTQSAYQDYLGRSATSDEVAYWVAQAAKGTDITSAVAGSTEAKIQALYQKYLGRTGEAAGVNFYEQAAANGVSWTQIEQGFASSEEARARSAALETAVQKLTTTMEGMQTAMNRTANSTQQLASQFDNVSAGGNALATVTP